jgi:uncharacterized protein YbjT (DUF2867 family)
MSRPDPKPTLVMGATGSIGRLVLAELIARGAPVRATARRPQPGQFPDGVEVRAADLTDPATLARAFEGVGQVFLYAHRDGVAGVITTARDAGVRRIVLMSSGSVLHPPSSGNAITEEHREIEDAFRAAADLDVIPIRPLVLATNALAWAGPIRDSRSVALYRPDAVTAPIHERDIAAVAVAALTDRDDTTDLLTGPHRISQRDQVAAIALAIGADITVDELSREAARARFSRSMAPTTAEAVLQFLDVAAAGGSPATDSVEHLLGRPPIGFGAWAVEHAADFR